MKIFLDVLLVALGGSLGAISRFAIVETLRRVGGTSFPLGTLLVNIAGCFLIGVLMGSGGNDSNERIRLLFGVGFLGSLTTFSAFGADTVGKIGENQYGIAIANISLNLILGLAAVSIGVMIGKRMISANG